ncbi:hypothetical protein CGCSCA4_v005166 [Colletotrichum siamense]|uniref:Uncharacterized protein n=1 Tax=Colletotrichum siamense TaxID=690259 RepID=A0A9P5K6T7_COLSI|nr:hypothetical protein CGCSCA4_v005166 [Colletotrichum siamense]KAF4861152.1 hypothetical protein CGCSCA2_v004628 [Colletotrichum siamense]
MDAAQLLRREPANPNCVKGCLEPPDDLEPNPDVGGVGVVIGFLGTAWLVVILATLRYCLVFDPATDPLENPDRGLRYGKKHIWKSNVIDVKTIAMFAGLRKRLGHDSRSRWTMAFNKILLSMCDIQLLTGLGILLSGFISLSCYMSAYHWKLISYLAWFSNLTHAACLSALRAHFYSNQTERNYRMVLMAVLLAALITAMVPTSYFNWDTPWESTASVPSSNARCFFSQNTAQAVWNSRICKDGRYSGKLADGYQCIHPSGVGPITATNSYESSMISIGLLIFNFVSRSIKMFRTLSEITKDAIRGKVARWSAHCLTATVKAHRRFGNTSPKRRLLAILRPLDLMISSYLVAKLYLEIMLSELADVSAGHTSHSCMSSNM